MKTPWKKSENKNYLGSGDLPDDKDTILTIKSAAWEEVENPLERTKERKRVIRWEEDFKPFIVNETNANAIQKSIGIRHMEESGGKKVALYVANIKAFGSFVEAVRVRKHAVKIRPELTVEHARFEEAKKAWNGGRKEGVLKQFEVSQETIKLLES